MSFERLTPETILFAVEKAAGQSLTALTIPLPSYINRVYELRARDGEKYIVKFYRPGRWSRDAILDEHRFVADCEESEVPVVPPVKLSDGQTLGEHDGFLFALYPKRAGRQLEITSDEYWPRIGSLVARMHLAAKKRSAPARIVMNPAQSTAAHLKELCDGVIPEKFSSKYNDVCERIISSSAPLFENLEILRVHGDCHRGNILDRLDQGLLLIDFDDMAMGPPVQDLWLLLPERASKSFHEIELFLNGYERFRKFDRASLRCIEPLRAMRMIHFLTWCSRQSKDFSFSRNFPNWGTDSFWQAEINDLWEQAGHIDESLEQ